MVSNEKILKLKKAKKLFMNNGGDWLSTTGRLNIISEKY